MGERTWNKRILQFVSAFQILWFTGFKSARFVSTKLEFLARWSVSARRFELEIDLVERGMETIVVHFLVHSLRTYPRNERPFLCVPLLTPINKIWSSVRR